MPLILGTNSIKDTGYNVANSLRFNKAGGSNDFLDLQYTADGNRRTFTISFWMKISKLNTNMYPISISDTSSGYQADIRHSSANQLRMYATDTAGTARLHLLTNRVFRDTTSWYHIHWQVDTTQSTESDRVKLFVNGTQETSFGTETYPPQNTDLRWNGRNNADTGGVTRVGAIQGGTGAYDGYLAEVCFIDGLALGADSFGEFDTDTPNVWKPIDVSGLTFGTNGFYLEYKQTGTNQDSSGFGADTSGSNNHFAVNNFTAIDQSTDTCTNNFCTLNPLTLQDTDFVLSEGNLKISIGGNNERKAVLGTFGLTSGKWYWEVKYTSTTGSSFAQIGISDVIEGTEASSENGKMGYFPYDYGYRGETSNSNGLKTNNGTFTSYGDTYTTGDIIGVALDLDNNKIFFSKNGTFQASGNPVDGSNPTFSITDPSSTGTGAYFPAIGKEAADDPVFEFNFGGTQSFTISSGNADGNGYGNFEYAVPSGYYSLNTKNLAEYG